MSTPALPPSVNKSDTVLARTLVHRPVGAVDAVGHYAEDRGEAVRSSDRRCQHSARLAIERQARLRT